MRESDEPFGFASTVASPTDAIDREKTAAGLTNAVRDAEARSRDEVERRAAMAGDLVDGEEIDRNFGNRQKESNISNEVRLLEADRTRGPVEVRSREKARLTT
jgi:hypothetical protein